jgi:Plavaka transposase
MTQMLQPLEAAGVNGVAMASGDGVVRQTHPLYAIFVGDYPEQILVACVKKSDCPVCPTTQKELRDGDKLNYRDMDAVLDAVNGADMLGPTDYLCACTDAGIKPIYGPFWQFMPYIHIFRSITPNILHQLYQGVIKHLCAWLKAVFGPVKIDACCRRLPQNHHIHLFMKGITTLSRLSGQEHGYICHILLGLIIDLCLPNNHSPIHLVHAVRALLDALYISQYPLHSTKTLALLNNAITRFEQNKQVFVDLGIREDFNINKFHFLKHHYTDAIMLYGTTDNYNTKYTERLHIDLAKDAYHASNWKDEYPQMTLWLEHREKISCHEKFIAWRQVSSHQLT